ncbi:polysaccharide pyruvyl transferase family protein [Cellulomonas fimi]|uniref:polysaccharide pyruvyl transferase family protein n=1 Tax=Cellulomonas fimi TaxID=1708 RepID=UPI00234C9BE5|nr:polysaccharide pyruvyl transferase family protein [Cellulomonas fimi]MDC7121642.1 polysaccharide pyruvyl transferase family protein [Cellulomonas fimi]
MRILVLWADDRSPNLGVRALAEGSRTLAEQAFPDAEVVLQDFKANADGVALDREAILADMRRSDDPVARILNGVDLVLDTGAGDSFTDLYGLGRLWILTYVRRAAARRRIPVVLMPQTYGPFRRRVSGVVARRGLGTVRSVVSRDPVSTAAAVRDLRRHAVESTDVVFALPHPAPGPARDVLLNVSGLLWSGALTSADGRYAAAMTTLVDMLHGSGRSVSLFAHVLDNDGADNDVRVLDDVRAATGLDLDVVVPRDLDDARSAVAGARLVIGARMHACLNALSVGTPGVAVAYSRKFQPLLESLDWTAVSHPGEPDEWARAIMRYVDDPALSETAARVPSIAGARLDVVREELRRIADERAGAR